jgi:hypothetical protein
MWFKLAREAFRAETMNEMFALTLIMDGRTAVSQRSQHSKEPTQYVACFKHWAYMILTDMEKPGHLSEEVWNEIHNNPIQEGVKHAHALRILSYRDLPLPILLHNEEWAFRFGTCSGGALVIEILDPWTQDTVCGAESSGKRRVFSSRKVLRPRSHEWTSDRIRIGRLSYVYLKHVAYARSSVSI